MKSLYSTSAVVVLILQHLTYNISTIWIIYIPDTDLDYKLGESVCTHEKFQHHVEFEKYNMIIDKTTMPCQSMVIAIDKAKD